MKSMQLLVSVAALTLVTQPCVSEDMRFQFKVISGTEQVCKDVAKRLEAKVFAYPPQCDRLLWDEGPPFGQGGK